LDGIIFQSPVGAQALDVFGLSIPIKHALYTSAGTGVITGTAICQQG
jgi:hypothetical protein